MSDVCFYFTMLLNTTYIFNAFVKRSIHFPGEYNVIKHELYFNAIIKCSIHSPGDNDILYHCLGNIFTIEKRKFLINAWLVRVYSDRSIRLFSIVLN